MIMEVAMTTESKNLEVKKEELAPAEGTERTRETRVYIPRTDIYETENEVVLTADVPGADEKSIDITLDKDRLTISAYVEPRRPENYSLAYAEYGVGDFQRSFNISKEIDREKIQAVVKDGVLRLTLPKREAAKTQKIAVKPA